MSNQSPASDKHPRLQKVLAAAGYGSRRQCEELILEGRVEIDRRIVTELGTRVDPHQQNVRVDGIAVKVPRHKYFVLHKPVGVISTARDPWARTRVIDLVDDPDRLFTVGRLDKSSSGLILVTNDGDLANQLAHPRFGIEKVYRVTVVGRPTGETLKKLRHGIYLADGKARMERASIKSSRAGQSILEVVLAEGRNREIRRLLARVGHKVQQLKRVGLGPLKLADLPVGAYRELTRTEVNQLRGAVSGRKPAKRPRKRPASASDAAAKGARGKTSKAKTPKGRKTPASASPSRRTVEPTAKKKKQTKKRGDAMASPPPAPRRKKSQRGQQARTLGTVLGDDSPESKPTRPKNQRHRRSAAKGA